MKTERPVRVLFLNTSVSGGGAGKALIGLIKGLDPREIECHVVLPFDGVVGDGLRAAGATVHYLPLLPERFGKTYLPIPGFLKFLRTATIESLLNIALFPYFICKMAALARRLKADLIYGNHMILFPIALGAGRITGRPVIIHGREILKEGSIGRWYFSWISRSSRLRKVICVSQATAKAYLHTGRTQVIYDGLDVDTYLRGITPCLRQELKLPPEVKVVGFMGRLVAWKGVPLLLEGFKKAAEQEKQIALVVVGGNDPSLRVDLLEQYRTLAREMGLDGRAFLLGFRKDVRPYAADFTMLVHPSTSPDPACMVLIEAMALGVPPVVAAHGGPPEMVLENQEGLHFPPGSADGLCAAILKLVRDPALHDRLGAQGKISARQRFGAQEGGELFRRAILDAARR